MAEELKLIGKLGHFGHFGYLGGDHGRDLPGVGVLGLHAGLDSDSDSGLDVGCGR